MSLLDVKQLYPSGVAFIDGVAPAADQSLVAAVTDYAIVVDELLISVGGGAANVFLESGASTVVFPKVYLAINTAVHIVEPGIRTARGSALTATTAGAASTTSVFVRYHLEA